MKQPEISPSFEWSNKLVIKKIEVFKNHIEKYCIKHNMPISFWNYLFHEYNGITSKTYRFLYTAPREYLAVSKTFRNFYYKLDKDFQDDIMTKKEYTEIIREIKINNELKIYLQTTMKKDFIL